MTETQAPASTGVITPDHTVQAFTREFLRELNFGQGVTLERSTVNDRYLALSRAVRHYLMSRWIETLIRQRSTQSKSVCYLSAEYLLGKQLGNALLATDLTAIAWESMRNLGVDLDELRAQEVEPGLGNGGLGRLAACFVDSLATMNVPTIGYGIRYEYGIFRQTFVDGWQVEQPDTWLALGAPWEFPHPEKAVTVGFGLRQLLPQRRRLGLNRLQAFRRDEVAMVADGTLADVVRRPVVILFAGECPAHPGSLTLHDAFSRKRTDEDADAAGAATLRRDGMFPATHTIMSDNVPIMHRRNFLKATAGFAVAGLALPAFAAPRLAGIGAAAGG